MPFKFTCTPFLRASSPFGYPHNQNATLMPEVFFLLLLSLLLGLNLAAKRRQQINDGKTPGFDPNESHFHVMLACKQALLLNNDQSKVTHANTNPVWPLHQASSVENDAPSKYRGLVTRVTKATIFRPRVISTEACLQANVIFTVQFMTVDSDW